MCRDCFHMVYLGKQETLRWRAERTAGAQSLESRQMRFQMLHGNPGEQIFYHYEQVICR